MPTKRNTNPYIAGKAINDKRGFFGRDDVFDFVTRTFSSSDQNSIVLYGQRRIGKTSILQNLRLRLPAASFVTVYFDLMDHARKPLAKVLYELAGTIASEINIPTPNKSVVDAEGRFFKDRFLPQVYTSMGKQRRLVFLLDEFDVLNVEPDEKLAPDTAALALFPYLRDLMTNEHRLAFVFVVGRKAEDLGLEFKSTFKESQSMRVSVLDEDSARKLISTAERDGSLRFADGVVDRILALTGRHPYFVQLVCQLAYERAYQDISQPQQIPSITSSFVEEIIPQIFEVGINIFEWIGNGLPPAETVILSAIAENTDESTSISREKLELVLQAIGIRIRTKELDAAPATLVEWEMLKLVEGGYQFFVELMRRWVSQNRPLKQVVDQLDRIDPLADALYAGGAAFYRHGDLESAIAQLIEALTINLNHRKARLLLGELYTKQGKHDEAVRELEEVYRIDQDNGRIPLENALLQRADWYERQNKSDDALRDYGRVIGIAPNNMLARERRSTIWHDRGEVALKAGNLEMALAHFNAASAHDRAADVENLMRKRDIEKQAQEAEKLKNLEQWELAVTAYQQLVDLDRDNPRWKEDLKKVQNQLTINRRYSEGLGAIQQSKWADAQRAFADVLNLKPDHSEAADEIARIPHRVRGEDALKRGDLDTAQIEFSAVGATNKLDEIKRLVRQREIDRLSTLAEQSERNADWERLIPLYGQLTELEPEKSSAWREKATQASDALLEQKLENQYREGLEFIEQNRLTDAQRILNEIHADRPEYRDTESLLARVDHLIEGESALQSHDWQKAQAAFEAAGASDKVAEVKRQTERLQQTTILINRADQYEKQKTWSEAAETYSQLSEIDNENKATWEEKQATAEKKSQDTERLIRTVNNLKRAFVVVLIAGVVIIACIGAVAILPSLIPTPAPTSIAIAPPTRTILPSPTNTATSVPSTATAVPSPMPPTPTAVPSPIPPTPVPTTVSIPTVTSTPVRPTIVPTLIPTAIPTIALASPTATIPVGIFVTKVTIDPSQPLRGRDMTFYVTFNNNTAAPQKFRWMVEIWDASIDRYSIGVTDGIEPNLSVGEAIYATRPYRLGPASGPVGCMPFWARVVWEDPGRHTFTRPDRVDYRFDFSICP